MRKIAREESISPHASRHKPPKVVSVRVLNLQIVIWCNKLCIPQHHVLDTTQIICLVFLFSTKVYTRVHQSRALYPMCAMRKSNSKPSKHHHIENSFESHNELRHGISGKFVINDTSRLRLGVRPGDSRGTFLFNQFLLQMYRMATLLRLFSGKYVHISKIFVENEKFDRIPEMRWEWDWKIPRGRKLSGESSPLYMHMP